MEIKITRNENGHPVATVDMYEQKFEITGVPCALGSVLEGSDKPECIEFKKNK